MTPEQQSVLPVFANANAPPPTGLQLFIETTSAILAILVTILLRMAKILWDYVFLTSYIWANVILLVATAVFRNVPLFAYIIGALLCVAKVSYEGIMDAIHVHQGVIFISNVITDITITGFLGVAIAIVFAIKQKFSSG